MKLEERKMAMAEDVIFHLSDAPFTRNLFLKRIEEADTDGELDDIAKSLETWKHR